MAKDFYQVLGLNKGANEQEIKSAYRKLALQWHPDKHKGEKDAEQRFKEINEAYEVLSDPQKRQQYDTFGSAGAGGQGFQGFGNGNFDFQSFGGGGFADIFESFFGASGFNGGRADGPRRGSDIEASIQISFRDAAFGAEKDLEITKPDGQGGRVKERVKVKIPAGIGNGSTIRLTGKGGKGVRGGRDGDLYITLLVEKHPKFVRAGADVHSEVTIHLLQGVLGTTIEVETLHGNAEIKVPAGTADGTVFKIAGKGAAELNTGGMGDHLVKVRLDVPKKLSKREKELYEELAAEAKIDVKKGGLFW